MNHKLILTRGIALILVMLVVTGCATPQAKPCPTSAPQACPTTELPSFPTSVPQSCPTAAGQAVPEMNTWRWNYAGGIPTNIIITFDPGDKCSMEIVNPVYVSYFSKSWNQVSYEIVVNDQTYENYVVWVGSNDPGTTQAQMDAVDPNDTSSPPSWVNLIQGTIVYPMSRTFHTGAIDITEGPLYITCMVQGPDALRVIGALGPLNVPTK
ncbi:MAG: hypothetical protein WAM09_15850 [Anaerolineales bacterium]